ncbi:MAG TPA: hypothetical protein VFN79_07985, partial [Steroidobacteraceae bacterium]|nr:hypothetical protein [Steroidobacteraceae bacterium]
DPAVRACAEAQRAAGRHESRFNSLTYLYNFPGEARPSSRASVVPFAAEHATSLAVKGTTPHDS